MPEQDIFAAIRIVQVSLIDTGRTVAIQVEKADGERTAILMSLTVCDDLQRQLRDALNDPGEGAA